MKNGSLSSLWWSISIVRQLVEMFSALRLGFGTAISWENQCFEN